ncbi:hypothetical protein Tco_0280559 [Tanacetum coccineum]
MPQLHNHHPPLRHLLSPPHATLPPPSLQACHPPSPAATIATHITTEQRPHHRSTAVPSPSTPYHITVPIITSSQPTPRRHCHTPKIGRQRNGNNGVRLQGTRDKSQKTTSKETLAKYRTLFATFLSVSEVYPQREERVDCVVLWYRYGEFSALEFREFSLSLRVFLGLSPKSSLISRMLALGTTSASFNVFSLTPAFLTVAMMGVTLAIVLIVSESDSFTTHMATTSSTGAQIGKDFFQEFQAPEFR